MSDMSLHTSRGGVAPSASLIEQLQSLLKQKEGELGNSQVHHIYLCMDSLMPRSIPHLSMVLDRPRPVDKANARHTAVTCFMNV